MEQGRDVEKKQCWSRRSCGAGVEVELKERWERKGVEQEKWWSKSKGGAEWEEGLE
jgi:hypothetical protein